MRVRKVKDRSKLYEAHAKNMFFNNILVIGGKMCRIAEVEFYRTSDPFIHGDPDQLTTGKFYFHKQNGKSYKGGTFKGLDITFGTAPRIYGGILIRSISTPDGFKEGPCNVVDYILENTDSKTINELVSKICPAIDQLPCHVNIEGACLRLIPSKIEESVIYKGPRVGLTLKKETLQFGKYCQTVMKQYRFTCFPAELKKCKYMMAVAARLNGIPDNTIVRDFKLQASILGRWVSHFIKGKGMHIDHFLSKENISLAKRDIQLNAFGFFSQLDMK